MGVIRRFFSNVRKPSGRIFVGKMNVGHAGVSDWGISHLPELHPAKIADFGCGGGRNADALMKKYPDAGMTALDYSEISVEKAEKLNAEAIKAGSAPFCSVMFPLCRLKRKASVRFTVCSYPTDVF